MITCVVFVTDVADEMHMYGHEAKLHEGSDI
jgi:hypothetical protein